MLFYLIGIKGSAMSGLANILLDYGYEVGGCDYEEYFFTQENLDVKIDSFTKLKLSKDYYYIIGNAFKEHSISMHIIRMGYHYDYYPHFLATFFSKQMVCVAGTHGKTTTTALISKLNEGVNYLIGDGSGRGNKDNKWFVIEACEYRDTFLNYRPEIALILNIDFDHPDYFKDIESVKNSFTLFAKRANLVVINGDEDNLIEIEKNMITYGLKDKNDIVFSYENNIVKVCDEEYELPFKGLHYAYDFVGAYIVSKLMNTSSEQIDNYLPRWTLPKRRREITVLSNQVVVCDYAHHPREIEALFNSLSLDYPEYRKIIIYEPHTYSRTIALMEDYIRELNQFDNCYLYNIFTSAREIYNAEVEQKIYKQLIFERFKDYLLMRFKNIDNAVIAFVGAGKIDGLYHKYIEYVDGKN